MKTRYQAVVSDHVQLEKDLHSEAGAIVRTEKTLQALQSLHTNLVEATSSGFARCYLTQSEAECRKKFPESFENGCEGLSKEVAQHITKLSNYHTWIRNMIQASAAMPLE